MIESIWLYPPLAFARLGPSQTPCDSYAWGPNDVSPRGTGKTTIVPLETLRVSANGTVSATTPKSIAFKDAAGFRPVCPFFELHGRFTLRGQTVEGPITPAVLADSGLTLADVRWRVDVANLKAFHYTLDNADRVAATLQLPGDVHDRRELRGVSPTGPGRPLVLAGRAIPLGRVQLTRPSSAFPELRLRFTPAAGRVYGPTDLPRRAPDWPVPAPQLILDPRATWCRFRVVDDARTNPSGLFAIDADEVSLGLVDDVCDGVITCTVGNADAAQARVVVGPPVYAPDRRPFVSLADGLTDRVRRGDVRDPAYVADTEQTTREIRDLMERVFETVGLVNADFQNLRARSENAGIAASLGLPATAANDRAFPAMEPLLDRPLPLTELARRQHRRFLSLEVFEDMLRERPDLIDQIVREPVSGERFYDREMPALFRGSDRHPMHLTRRQYDLLKAWAARLRAETEPGT